MASINQRTLLIILCLVNKHICDELTPNEIDLITENEQEEAIERIPETDDFSNTTEVYNVTEELPEALRLKNNDTEEEERSEEAVTPAVDTTEGIEENTLSSAENFYKDDEVFTSQSTVEMKTETTSAPSTTRAMDDETSNGRSSESEEDLETTGQRSLNTESSESPLSDNLNYEAKPQLPPTTKSSTLRTWLEDSWLRPPAAVLVPLRPMALNRALAVWKDLTVEGLNVTDIVIVGYDSNGVNWRSRHNLQPSTGLKDRDVAEALSKLLLKYQGVHTDTASDGTMRALASAAKLVPYDSALFVVTDKGAGDLQRLPLALRTLVEKRLKVYTIWTDPNHPSMESEMALEGLRSISQHTEGDVLPYSLQVMDVDGSSNFASETEMHWQPLVMSGRQGRFNHDLDIDRFDTLLVRRGGGEAIPLGLPVETGVTALRIYIEGAVEHAILYPPNDAPQIDLYNESSVSAFSPASRTDGLSPRDVYLLFPGTTFDEDTLSVIPANPKSIEANTGLVGVWHFSVRCDTCDYRLCVTAQGQIHLDAATNGADTLKIRVTGPVASVRESLLVDEYGTELAKLSFSYQPMTGEVQSDIVNPSSGLVDEVIMPPVRASKMYVKIFGRDNSGEPFIRLAGPLHQPEVRLGRSASIVFQDSVNDLERIEEENTRAYLQRHNETGEILSRAVAQVVNQQGTILTAVQIGLSTRLIGSPGDRLQLHFEVTNNREQAVRFTFGAVGELRFLTGISPYSQTLQSRQTVNVVVSAAIPSTAQPGFRDLVTFTAYAGSEQVSISAYIYVVSDSIRDTWAPEVRHNFQGSCIGRMGEDCAQHIWSATVVARDSGGGLLRVSSSPNGLMYNDNFISGTKEEVVTTYRSTCCTPRMLVNAVDVYGNTNSYVVDISNYFSEATIAAIVLGIILAIALIALVIFLICLCVRRRKESRELPSFSTSRNIS